MVFKQEIRSGLKSFIIWTSCIAGLDFIMLLFYPSLQDTMKQMAGAYQSMGAFGTAFGMDHLDLGTAMGFYGMYVGAILSLGGAMFAAILGIRLLSKEEEGHTAEYLFTLPFTRRHVVSAKILAVIATIFIFEVINFVFGVLGLAAIGSDYSFKVLLIFHIGQTFMHLEVAAITVLISACTKKSAIGAGLGIALLMYFMDMMSRVLTQLKNLKYITPFYYCNAAEVFINEKIDLVLLGIGILVTIVCVVFAIEYYEKKDLAA